MMDQLRMGSFVVTNPQRIIALSFPQFSISGKHWLNCILILLLLYSNDRCCYMSDRSVAFIAPFNKKSTFPCRPTCCMYNLYSRIFSWNSDNFSLSLNCVGKTYSNITQCTLLFPNIMLHKRKCHIPKAQTAEEGKILQKCRLIFSIKLDWEMHVHSSAQKLITGLQQCRELYTG